MHASTSAPVAKSETVGRHELVRDCKARPGRCAFTQHSACMYVVCQPLLSRVQRRVPWTLQSSCSPGHTRPCPRAGRRGGAVELRCDGYICRAGWKWRNGKLEDWWLGFMQGRYYRTHRTLGQCNIVYSIYAWHFSLVEVGVGILVWEVFPSI
jgi:hypothetical protein